MIMEFKIELKEKTKKINDKINIYIESISDIEPKIFDAIKYSITVGGKRLRPLFLIESGINFYKEDAFLTKDLFEDILYNYSIAIDLIHTYSLVHDDVPSFELDMYCRGYLPTHA